MGSALAVMRASKNLAIFVTVLEDSAALVGLALAAGGLTASHWLGMPVFEAVASILIGAVLMIEAGLLGFECRSLIIGEAARPLVIASVRRVIADHPGAAAVRMLRTLQLGPDAVMLVLHIRPEPGQSVGDLRKFLGGLMAQIRWESAVVRDIVFELAAEAD